MSIQTWLPETVQRADDRRLTGVRIDYHWLAEKLSPLTAEDVAVLSGGEYTWARFRALAAVARNAVLCERGLDRWEEDGGP